MSNNFKADDGKYTVEVNRSTKHGYFECNHNGDGGGLWFEVSTESTEGDADRKLTLIDYDGMFELPDEVIDILRNGGFIVGKEFE